MKRITVKAAADRLGICEQATRKLIQKGLIGEITNTSKYRNSYYLTDVMIDNFMKGGTADEGRQ